MIVALTVDHGDGSTGLRWFRDPALAQKLLDDELCLEEFYGNEGSPNTKLTFPDDLDLEACGFQFSDEQYRSRVGALEGNVRDGLDNFLDDGDAELDAEEAAMRAEQSGGGSRTHPGWPWPSDPAA